MFVNSNIHKALVVILAFSIRCNADAFSFRTIWRTIRSSATQVLKHRFTMPITIGLSAAAIMGAAAYYVKKDFDRVKAEKEGKRKTIQLQKGLVCLGNEQVPGWSLSGGKTALNQIEVVDQFSTEGRESGSFSCGYHALKNIVGITALIKEKGAAWVGWLNDMAQAKALFALKSPTQKPGPWRADIIQQRESDVMFDGIYRHVPKPIDPDSSKFPELYKSLGNDSQPVNQEYYSLQNQILSCLYDNLFVDYVKNISQEIVSKNTPMQVSRKNFVAWIKNQSWSEHLGCCIDNLTERHVELAKKPEMLDAYVPLSWNETHQFSRDMLDQFNEEKFKQTCTDGKQNGVRTNLDGDWLYYTELDRLWTKIQTKNEHLKQVELLQYQSSGSIEKIAEKINNMISQRPKDVYPIIINPGAHYIALVVDTYNGNRRYTVADSMHNNKQLDDSIVLGIVDKLERGDFASRVRPLLSKSAKSFGLARYCSHVWHCLTRAWF